MASHTHAANSLHNIATGLLRHFRDDLKRFDLNILAKNDANLSSFRNALDSIYSCIFELCIK